MTGGSPNRWTLRVLLDASWECVPYPSREAAMETLESILADYGDRVAMAHFICPKSHLASANLEEIRARQASLTRMASRELSSHPSA